MHAGESSKSKGGQVNRGETLRALIEAGRLSIIPVGFTGEGEGEREREREGERGYTTRLTGAYVCYTCGHLCECGESESD